MDEDDLRAVTIGELRPLTGKIDRMLQFRDWLRDNAPDRELYARTKRELARRAWTYTQDYADAKTAVVEEIFARALAARQAGAPSPRRP